jgi:hypothetical protein
MILNTKQKEDEKIFAAVLKFNAKFLSLALGLIMGLAIFIATNWLLIKGGHTTSNGEYVVGTLCGAVFGLIYNKIVDFRN